MFIDLASLQGKRYWQKNKVKSVFFQFRIGMTDCMILNKAVKVHHAA